MSDDAGTGSGFGRARGEFGPGEMPAEYEEPEVTEEYKSTRERLVEGVLGDKLALFGALVVVLGLLVLLRVFLRRVPGLLAGGGQPSGVLEILARYPVGRGQSLMILKLARRVLLVHQAGTSMHTLTEVTGEDEVASLLSRMEAGSRSRDAVRFRSALRTFQQEHEGHASSRFLPGDEAGRDRPELVDLTRRRGRGLRALVRGGRDSS